MNIRKFTGYVKKCMECPFRTLPDNRPHCGHSHKFLSDDEVENDMFPAWCLLEECAELPPYTIGANCHV